MNRREALLAMVGAPVLLRGVDGARIDVPLPLQPSAVLRDGFEIHEDSYIRTFELTLSAQPWPKVGETVQVQCPGTRFEGVVTKTRLRSSGTGRWVMHVQGITRSFAGEGPKDA